jgi:hypothetical protein
MIKQYWNSRVIFTAQKNPKQCSLSFGITENKQLAISAIANYTTRTVFHFDITFTRKTDHAGIRLNLDLFGFAIELELYDCRHWNYQKNRWTTDSDQLNSNEEPKCQE